VRTRRPPSSLWRLFPRRVWEEGVSPILRPTSDRDETEAQTAPRLTTVLREWFVANSPDSTCQQLSHLSWLAGALVLVHRNQRCGQPNRQPRIAKRAPFPIRQHSAKGIVKCVRYHQPTSSPLSSHSPYDHAA